MDRNFILAIVLSMAVLLGWDIFIAGPQREALQQARREAAAETEAADEAARAAVGEPQIGETEAPAPSGDLPVEDAIAATPARVAIETPSLTGSINLAGARIDDLSLKNYRETLDDESPMIRLLSPANTEHGHYIQIDMAVGGNAAGSHVWQAADGAKLTPETPVTLTRREGGLIFERTISVDDRYMFEVTQKVTNETGEAAVVTPYGVVIQRGIPDGAGKWMILHEGPISVVGDSLYEKKYKKAVKTPVSGAGDRGWVGITNKYWLAAAIPPQGELIDAKMRNIGSETAPIFQSAYELEPRTVAPGETLTLVSHMFGGAKDVDVLQSYEKEVEDGGLGVWDFDKAVDWGNFFFLTRPIFYTLNFFGDLVGNFGVAILLLTLVIKALLFPLANKAYDSMSKMKKLQPEMVKLQERYKEDKVKLQQEMMALYKRENANPLAGCLPILIQMPIFYALYKTLFVTIELRHAPFFGWIRDLSAPDPTSIFNLFGLLPYDPMSLPLIGAFLGIGVLPLLMGVAMWFQTKLNPPPADPVQAQIFALMPIMFTFLFASFAAGLVLYWFWNTFLSILQQWAIMKKNGVAVDWKSNMGFGGGAAAGKPAAGGK